MGLIEVDHKLQLTINNLVIFSVFILDDKEVLSLLKWQWTHLHDGKYAKVSLAISSNLAAKVIWS